MRGAVGLLTQQPAGGLSRRTPHENHPKTKAAKGFYGEESRCRSGGGPGSEDDPGTAHSSGLHDSHQLTSFGLYS